MDSCCEPSVDPHNQLSETNKRPQRRRRIFARVIHRIYKITLSPFIGRSCRFTPTCSDYGLEAVETYGWIRGGCMAVWRVVRCNPFTTGGADPLK